MRTISRISRLWRSKIGVTSESGLSLAAIINYVVEGTTATFDGLLSTGTITGVAWTLTGPEDASGPDGSAWGSANLSGPGRADWVGVTPPGGWMANLTVTDGISSSSDFAYILWDGTSLNIRGTPGNATEAPTVSNGVSLGPTSVSVDVAIPPGAALAAVYVNGYAGNEVLPWTQIVTVTANGTVTIEGLTPSTDYYINSHAADFGFTSADSAGVIVTTDPE